MVGEGLAMETVKIFKMALMCIFLHESTGQIQYLILIGAARAVMFFFMLILFMVRTASLVATAAAMLRMYVLAVHAFSKGDYKAFSASATRMYAKADDTDKVPSYQQSRKHLYNQAFHTNLQIYNFVPKLQYPCNVNP